MQNFLEEISEWENELYVRNMQRMYKTGKNFCDPRKKRLEDYRHHRNTKYWYRHECKWIRIHSNRKTRRKLKSKLLHEAYYKPVPHDYKTYGWLTW